MELSQLLAFAFPCVTTVEIGHGTGRHASYLNPQQRSIAIKLDWISQALHIMCLLFAKLPIVILYYEYKDRRRPCKRGCYMPYSSVSPLAELLA